MSKIIFYMAFFLLLLPVASALGVSPATTEVYFEPGSTQFINLKIHNPEHKEFIVNAEASGDLKDIISFPRESITIRENIPMTLFTYRIKLPKELTKQGVHRITIHISTQPEETTSNMQIRTQTSLEHTLKLIVPYSEKYLDADLELPEFHYGTETMVPVTVQNFGSVDIAQGIAVIDVTDPEDTVVDNLESKSFGLRTREKKLIFIPWTPMLMNGTYTMLLKVVYDSGTAIDAQTISLGTPNIRMSDLSVESFTLGEIAHLSMDLNSRWNQKIKGVYAQMTVIQDQKEVGSFTSPSIDIEAGSKTQMDIFWDTKDVDPGRYLFKVDLHYGKYATSHTTVIYVTKDTLSFTQEPVPLQVERGARPLVGIVLAIIIIAIAVYIVMRKKKSRF